ncbi:MAG: Rossmann-like and DUF2520 domain-containing protein [Bacteroidota bacterium]
MKTQLKKIVLIGAGNVATHLGMALKKSKHTILQVYSHTKKSSDKLSSLLNTDAINDLKEIDPNADVYIIAIKDDSIIDVIKKLKLQDKIVVHTSGSTSIDVLKNASENYGVFYPLQTFSKIKKVGFKNIPICLEANNNRTYKTLFSLAKSISDNIQKVDSVQRKALHVAAVFACNFSNHLYAVAEQILKKNKLPFDILKPLIEETADKIKNNSPIKMQTGPAVRGDKKIMDAHLKMLAGHKEYQKLYKLLSQSIDNTKR